MRVSVAALVLGLGLLLGVVLSAAFRAPAPWQDAPEEVFRLWSEAEVRATRRARDLEAPPTAQPPTASGEPDRGGQPSGAGDQAAEDVVR